MNKSIYNKLTKFWIPLAIILNALFLVLQIVLLFLDVSSLIGTIFVCIIQLIVDGILYIYSYRLMTNQVNMKYGIRVYREYRKAKREILEGKLDKASDRAIAVMSEASKIRNTVKKVNRKFRLVIILATVLSMIVSTMLSYYTFIVEDSSLGAIIENIISKKKEDEKKDDYEWDFGEKSWKREIDNKTYEYSYEGDLVVQIALEVAQKYKDEGLIGGDIVWDWAGRPFGRATALVSDNGVYWSSTRKYAVWDWCSSFAAYCSNKSGLTEPGGTLEGVDNGALSHYYSSTSLYNYCVRKGWEVYEEFSSYVPQPGDFVFYRNTSTGKFTHTSLFYKVDGNKYRTIEGNVSGNSANSADRIYCETSIVTDQLTYMLVNNKLFNNTGTRQLIIVHPPYKTIKTLSNNGTGGSDIMKILDYYEKDSNGYIKDTQQVIYDVMVSYLGYSTEAACAMIVNNYCESAYYDQFEGHLTGYHYGNGNWKYITEYKVNTKEEADKYLRGMTSYNKGGYGIVQWTGGRIQGYLDVCDRINMCACGPETFPAQIIWMTEELKSGTRGVRTTTALNDCAGKGIDGVKYTARVLRHDYETPGVCCLRNSAGKIIGRKDFNTCDGCSGQIAQDWGGVPLYQFVWDKWGNTEPTVDFSGKTGNTTAQNASFSDVVMVGDSNTVRMKSSGTSITNAKKIIAEVGEGLSSTTILNQIKALKADDLSNVCIMLGTNNFSAQKVQFVSAYENLINEIYKINPNANITLCTIPRVNDSYSPSIKDATTVTISDWIKEIANKGNLNLIDVNGHLTPDDMSTASGDGYHLNISNGGVQKCADFITSSYTGSSRTTNTGGITPVVSR